MDKMKDKEIKKWIRNHFNLHGNQKIILNKNKFWIKLGDCESIQIDFPISLKRQLKLESILNDI